MKRLATTLLMASCVASGLDSPDAPDAPDAPDVPDAPVASSTAPAFPVAYEYTHPYNTPDLVENHAIVLDEVDGRVRGWYYGTSDEFDAAREGYLPGFFVAEMKDLALSPDSIAFSLMRPDRFFTTPVPTRYRSSETVSAGLLEQWDVVSLPMDSVSYAGVVRAGEIVLTTVGGERAFRGIPIAR